MTSSVRVPAWLILLATGVVAVNCGGDGDGGGGADAGEAGEAPGGAAGEDAGGRGGTGGSGRTGGTVGVAGDAGSPGSSGDAGAGGGVGVPGGAGGAAGDGPAEAGTAGVGVGGVPSEGGAPGGGGAAGEGGVPESGGAAGAGGVPDNGGAAGEAGAAESGGAAGEGGTTALPCDAADIEAPMDGGVQFLPDDDDPEFAVFSCELGFELDGPNSLSCQSNGTWSGQEPACVVVTCPGLRDPNNGSVDFGDQTYGTVAVYECDEGYEIEPESGDVTRECLANGTWDGTAPTCQSQCGNGTLDPYETCDGSALPAGCGGAPCADDCSVCL